MFNRKKIIAAVLGFSMIGGAFPAIKTQLSVLGGVSYVGVDSSSLFTEDKNTFAYGAEIGLISDSNPNWNIGMRFGYNQLAKYTFTQTIVSSSIDYDFRAWSVLGDLRSSAIMEDPLWNFDALVGIAGISNHLKGGGSAASYKDKSTVEPLIGIEVSRHLQDLPLDLGFRISHYMRVGSSGSSTSISPSSQEKAENIPNINVLQFTINYLF